jgi:hypothetical protein
MRSVEGISGLQAGEEVNTRKRAEDGAACESHLPQGAGIGGEPIQHIRAMGGRGDPRSKDQ